MAGQTSQNIVPRMGCVHGSLLEVNINTRIRCQIFLGCLSPSMCRGPAFINWSCVCVGSRPFCEAASLEECVRPLDEGSNGPYTYLGSILMRYDIWFYLDGSVDWKADPKLLLRVMQQSAPQAAAVPAHIPKPFPVAGPKD